MATEPIIDDSLVRAGFQLLRLIESSPDVWLPENIQRAVNYLLAQTDKRVAAHRDALLAKSESR